MRPKAPRRRQVGWPVNERLVWIDCEMTGLDLQADALIEVAALVTDFDLNVLGPGRPRVKPPPEAMDQMIDFVREMHNTSGLIEELDNGTTLEDAEEQVFAYIASTAPTEAGPHSPATRWPPTGRSSPGTCRPRAVPALPDRRRLLDQGAVAALVPPRLLQRAGQERQPPCARRHPGEHRGAAVLPGGGFVPSPGPDSVTASGSRSPPGGTDRARRRPDRVILHRPRHRARRGPARFGKADPN